MTTNYKQPQNFMGGTIGVTEVKITHAELSAAAVTEVVTVASLLGPRAFAVPANAELIGAVLIVHTDFSGGAVATCTLKLGDAGADDELISAANIFTGAKAAQALTAATLSVPLFEAAAYVPIITITTTVANVVALTAGSATVRIRWIAHDLDSRI